MKKADKNLLSGSTTLLVLSLLSSGDKYGYEMIAELEARSDHTFTLKEGTLYPILHTLEKDGAVKSYEKEAPTGRMRKYYRITRKGLRLLDEKKEEWVEFTHTVNAILAGTSPALAWAPRRRPPTAPSASSATTYACTSVSGRTTRPSRRSSPLTWRTIKTPFWRYTRT